MDTAFIINAFVTLFVIVDPLGLTPLFAALTQGMSKHARRAIALRACITAFCVLVVFTLFGQKVLDFVGISMPAFRIAGGLLLFFTAFDMLFEKRTQRREDKSEHVEAPDPSVFPLAIPLIAGPGAIATVILLAGHAPGTTGLLVVLGVVAVMLAVVFVALLTAHPLEHMLGRTGVLVITRLLGMMLAALAVQFVLTGLRDFGLVS